MSKPKKIDQSKNGVRVMKYVWADGGSVVEADCNCFGVGGRMHSSQQCPLLKKQAQKRGC